MKAREKKERLAAETAVYLRQIGRKAQKGQEPNDRGFDRKLDEKLKRMRPEDVDALIHGVDEEDPANGSYPPFSAPRALL
ncbi:hypothetical protein AWL63_12160 [Sphingomonas panacis]|uniref:Uncharacterized protein n=1 Tax=Sphingomonas panacis TaxID=1560345 RepID=A0A1B3ZB11_9SPHN|nr:hypothetical protein [Sphingomonas panacis]AOH84610.1 hypothetical protein AWL63_12160 [Sphingomonas panacis]